MEKTFIEKKIKMYDTLPDLRLEINDHLIIKKVDEGTKFKTSIRDTFLLDEDEEHELLNAKSISFIAGGKKGKYKVTLIKLLVESEDLIWAISISLFTITGLFILALYVINSKLSKKIWSPFYLSLEQVKRFDISSAKKIHLDYKTDITEFNELNRTIEAMIDKIFADYQNLKEFTENASHEIQTPLAIIKNKLELLIQTENLNSDQMLLIESINGAANKLSKLNKSLLLLTKIENEQFQEKEVVNLGMLFEKQIDNFRELINAKEIKYDIVKTADYFATMNLSLAEILVNNLVWNAIKHNYQKGKIQLVISNQGISISNTGDLLRFNAKQLFERFKKNNSASTSLGLGLSIVKKICDSQQIQINYSFSDPIHKITLEVNLQN